MRIFIAATLLVLFGIQEQTVAPKVEHKMHEEKQVYDEITRSCPSGYEGHFVDIQKGFGSERYWGYAGYFTTNGGTGEVGYTVCFKKEFMDEIRKNPELLIARPAPPRPV